MTYYAAPGVLKSATRAFTFEDIEKVVCRYYSVDPGAVKGSSRKHEIVLARQVIAYFAVEFLTFGVKSLGELMNRHYSTVIVSRNVISGYVDVDHAFRAEIENLRRLIKDIRYND